MNISDLKNLLVQYSVLTGVNVRYAVPHKDSVKRKYVICPACRTHIYFARTLGGTRSAIENLQYQVAVCQYCGQYIIPG